VARATYDRDLAAGRYRERRRQHNNNGNATNARNEQEFENFMDMFDKTVAGMSEEELNMAMGAASVVGAVIGSILGARAAKGNSFISSAASMVGSAMASQAAATLVKTVHEDSTQRALEKEERDAAIARGERVSQPTASESRERIIQDAVGAVSKMAAAAAMFASGQNRGRQDHNIATLFSNTGSIRFSFGNGAGARSGSDRSYRSNR